MTNEKTLPSSRLDLPSWRFAIEKLGGLNGTASHILFNPLTLVCGPNNTGKTWVLYALYGFLTTPGFLKLPEVEQLMQTLRQTGQVSWNFEEWLKTHRKRILALIHQGAQRRLPQIFNSDPESFKESRFDWEVDADTLMASALARELDYRFVLGRDSSDALRLVKPAHQGIVQMTLMAPELPDLNLIVTDVITRHLIGIPQRYAQRSGVFLMPAERNGLHLFYRELANRRTALLHHAAKKEKSIDIGQLILDVVSSKYAEPIAHYIDWLNELPVARKNKGGSYHALAEEVKGIVNGRYEVDAEGDISFTPYKTKRGNGETPLKMDLHLTSSTVKSLFGLWFYLEHEAQPGDVLMIDEPELNLHPANQRRLARLLAKLVNQNLRVVVSTHSDYLVREMNSLIMLAQKAPIRDALLARFGYQTTETLTPEQVSAWVFKDRCIEAMPISTEEGIAAETFDEVIHQLNDTSDAIYFAYQDGASAREAD